MVTEHNVDSVTLRGLNGKALDAMLAIQDAYTSETKGFVAFLRSNGYSVSYEGLKAFAAHLDSEHDGKRYSARTYNKHLSAAKNRIRYLTKSMDLHESVRFRLEKALNEVKAKKINSNAVPEDRILTFDEVQALMDRTKDKTVALFVEFLFYTGCRISEALGILLTDIQPTTRSRFSIRILGKRKKERMITVSKKLVEKVRANFQGDTWLFEHSGKQYSRTSVSQRIKLESLKILGRDISAHTLRHSCATHLIKKSGRVKAVQEQLGHSYASTTLDLYCHDRFSADEYESLFEEAST